jgi:hypothetical protein
MPRTMTMLLCVGLVSAITTAIAMPEPASAEPRQVSLPSPPTIRIVLPAPKQHLGAFRIGDATGEYPQNGLLSHAVTKQKTKCSRCTKIGG